MRIRLTDVAQQAGVSTATVSRVLNGKAVVAPETRKAVLTALDILGYERPEKLRQRSGGLIGLIVPELSNPIFPMIAQNLESVMSLHGFTPLLCTQAAGGVSEDTYIQVLLDHNVDGIIFVSGRHADSTCSTERYLDLHARGIPFVTVNGNHPDVPAPDFSTDDGAAIVAAIRHLIAYGHERIGLAVGPDRYYPSHDKESAYHRVMDRMLPDSEHVVVHSLYTADGGATAAHELYNRGCTGLIFASDMMAMGGMRSLRQQGILVPRDASVIGFDDSPVSTFCFPSLTTIRQPVETMCETIVNTLIGIINGEEPPIGSMTFQPELIVRESTGAAPAPKAGR